MEESRVALVTGASRGIGAAIAIELARQGVRVAVNYNTDREGAELVANAINRERGGGSWAMPIQGDVGNPEDITRMVQDTKDAAKTDIDILVNNAGMTKDGPFARMTYEDFMEVLRVNLVGPFLLMKEVIPGMSKRRWGRIVNVSSVAGLEGHAFQANYCAAKAGLNGLTMALAAEYSRKNVIINSVAPGFIETDMTKEVGEDLRKQAVDQSAVRRLGTPEDIAPFVAFLCSDGASFITRQVLVADGGLGL